MLHYVGCNFVRDDDGTMCFDPRKSIDKVIDCYCNDFVPKPKLSVATPLKNVITAS